jgi:hypothetical protein
MSKPLEALNKIANHVNYKETHNGYYENMYADYPQEFELLKQALQRNEPMKLVTHGPGQKPTCDNCYNHEPNSYDNYCSNCGQALDWRNNNE